MKVLSKKVYMEKPKERTGVLCNTYYTGTGMDMMKLYSYIHKSDAADISFKEFSSDNGKTFGAPITIATEKKMTKGTLRNYVRSPIVDKKRNRLITFGIKGVLPTDDPIEGMKWWHVYYMVSTDGGKSNIVEEPVILQGDEFNKTHPVTDVFEGKNSVMIGDTTQLAIIASRQNKSEDNDHILLPVQITPVGPDGSYYNPGGGLTYHYSAVIRGNILDDGHITWTGISNKISNEPTLSTRGSIEPTIVEFDDGTILMVLRGSNGGSKDYNHKIKGYRWYSVSTDGGKTFSKIKPWLYDTNEHFYSPSSCSQLLRHSSGKIYWIGNISPSNPKANMPRNPIYIGEVDKSSLLLKKDTLLEIDSVKGKQSKNTTFSNFYAREDKQTGRILLHITPFHQTPDNIFGSHAYIYDVEVK